MKVSSGNKPVQTLVNKVKRGNIVLKHKLQRREGVWNKETKSLLIDSLLRGYIVNPIHTISEGGKQYVIDGVQRLSTLSSFLNDEFALSKNLKPVEIENESYEIAGKKFSKLDEPVADALNSAQIQVYEITEYTDKDVRDMFSRLNSGRPLNTTQKMTPNLSDYMSDAIVDIVSHPFFEKALTPAQFKSSVDQAIAMEVLMLCATTEGYEIASFSRKDKEKFIEQHNYDQQDEKVALIKQALDKLDENLDDEVKIPKTSLSFIIFAVCRVIKEKKGMAKAMDAIKDFLANYDSNEEYKGYITQGTSGGESINNRLQFWRNIVKSL